MPEVKLALLARRSVARRRELVEGKGRPVPEVKLALSLSKGRPIFPNLVC